MPEPKYLDYLRGLDPGARQRYLEEMARADVASMRHEGVEIDFDAHLEELRASVAKMLEEDGE